MAYEILVGLHVLDENIYKAYRTAIGPLLTTYGASFGYDFKVSEVLRPDTDKEINRVFTLSFRDNNAMEAFFTDSEYLDIKQALFEKAVGKRTIIAGYQKHDSMI